MANTFTFDLVSPEKQLASVEAEMVTLPGVEGDMGVMAGHMSLISTLRDGEVIVKADGGETKYHVTGGFADISADKLTVLATKAEEAAA